jgi:hypothetical protein
MGNLKYAIDHWWLYLDDAGKVEVTAYFLKKTGVRVSWAKLRTSDAVAATPSRSSTRCASGHERTSRPLLYRWDDALTWARERPSPLRCSTSEQDEQESEYHVAHTSDVAKGENQMNPIHETEHCIFVEGPRWADAEFYGKWLLMATKAQGLWEKALKDSRFEKQIELLTAIYFPQFDHSASLFLFLLKDNFVSFTIPLRGEDSAELDQFALMAEMGFFVLTEWRYQMAIPARLNMDVVKIAALKYAKTELEDEGLHPEWLVTTMPYALAEEWQRRLRDIEEEQRCVERAALLDKHQSKQLRKPGSCGGQSAQSLGGQHG